MLSYKEYNRLSLEKKAQILWKEGIPLDLKRTTNRMNIELYSLHNFYVELYFNIKTAEPLLLKPFIDMNKLDAYLHSINVEQLVESRNNDLSL